MASFISKLSKECDKYGTIIDQRSIKTLHFESDMSTPHQILGPLFKDAVPPAITELFKDQCLTPLLLGFEWSRWDLVKPQGSWPSTTATWAARVAQMEKIFASNGKLLAFTMSFVFRLWNSSWTRSFLW
ncbi:hypothetical protein ACFX2C_019359 [Malus domestica]